MSDRGNNRIPGSGSRLTLARRTRLNELSGFVELSMEREATALVRQLLRSPRIKAVEFTEALSALQTHGSRLKRLKPLVEAAHARLPARDKRAVRSDMLGFYYTLEDWESACRFLPARSKNAADLMFAMETLLNLRKLDEAKRIRKMCLRMLEHPMDTFHQAALFSALGDYHAQRAEPGAAEDYFFKMAQDEIFAPSAAKAIFEIAALRGLLQVWAAQLGLNEFRQRGTDEHAISMPGNRDGRFADAERDLKRYEKAFYRILPKNQLWRYGWSAD